MNRNEANQSLGLKRAGRAGAEVRISRRHGTIAALAVLVAAWGTARPSRGQGILPRDFLEPRLVVNGTGHTGELRSMIYIPDGKGLLSAGLDKVVHVWEARGQWLRLDRSIRPMIRNSTGVIYAMALSPKPDERGQRLLAVAGRNPLGSGGRILVYRVPGLQDAGTGDLAFDLSPSDDPSKPIVQQRGHRAAVFGLSFSEGGRYLASCGVDKTVRVWDLATKDHPTVRVLEGHRGAVQCVAFLDGNRLVSGGGLRDGALVLWEWDRPGPLLVERPPSPEDTKADPGGVGVLINALAVSPDRRFVVLGRENGQLERYDAADLGHRTYLHREPPDRARAVESIAVSPDSQSVAVSRLKYAARDFPNEFPRTECEIRIRNMADGAETTVVREAGGIVRALAFSPDGRFLAMGGGAAQEIAVKDLAPSSPGARAPKEPPGPKLVEFRGPGTALWNVAFVGGPPEGLDRGKLVIAYARDRPLGQAAPAWEGFDLSQRKFVAIGSGPALSGPIKTIPGWTVDISRPDRVGLVPARGDRIVVRLDLQQDRRWSSYTFIPANANAGHPRPAVAIGCEGGTVLVHTLPDGKRSRVFQGHSGGARGLAVSADGRWLASASSDQTVRLWRLDGCDRRPALGARFSARPDARGRWAVEAVERQGFADQMGLKAGDLVLAAALSGGTTAPTPVKVPEIPAVAETMALGSQSLSIVVQRPAQAQAAAGPPARAAVAQVAQLQTSLRDLPVLSFLPGNDHEWIVWTPEGHYDTSIAGDHRLLGWHVNKLTVIQGQRVPLPSDFFPISKYRAQLRRPLLIDGLLAGAPNNAPAPVVKAPPKIEIVAPAGAAAGAVVAVRQPRLSVQFRAEGSASDRRVRSLTVYNGTRHGPPRPINPPAEKAELTEEVLLQPNENSIAIEAEDEMGVKRTSRFLVRLDLPQPPPAPAPPRLLVRSIGVQQFADPKVHAVPYATNDARELASFLTAPGGRERFRPDAIQRVVAAGEVTAREIDDLFNDLAREIESSALGTGDTLFLVIDSHVLNLGREGAFLLGSDARAPDVDKASVRCERISECLEKASARGCLVMVLLDGIHEALPMRSPARRDLDNWVRDLVDERGAMVLLASKDAPSKQLAEYGHGAFAKAVLDSITAAGRAGGPSGDATSPTLHDFQEAVVRGVERLTGRVQFADFYPPEILGPRAIARIRIFEPQLRSVENVAKK